MAKNYSKNPPTPKTGNVATTAAKNCACMKFTASKNKPMTNSNSDLKACLKLLSDLDKPAR